MLRKSLLRNELGIWTRGRGLLLADLGTAITALVRPGDHRADAPLVIGTADGRVLLLPQD